MQKSVITTKVVKIEIIGKIMISSQNRKSWNPRTNCRF